MPVICEFWRGELGRDVHVIAGQTVALLMDERWCSAPQPRFEADVRSFKTGHAHVDTAPTSAVRAA